MKVKVKEDLPEGFYGFYEVRRRPGDIFEIASEAHFSDKWMVKVENKKPAKKPKTVGDLLE